MENDVTSRLKKLFSRLERQKYRKTKKNVYFQKVLVDLKFIPNLYQIYKTKFLRKRLSQISTDNLTEFKIKFPIEWYVYYAYFISRI